jgi:curved DNA-binding protein
MSLKRARETLGVAADAMPAEIRRAFREAAKRVHPDRPDGDAEAFRIVVLAHQRLSQRRDRERLFQPPAVAAAAEPLLEIPVEMAVAGGRIERTCADGRRLRLKLPAGLRSGDRVRAGGVVFEVAIRGDGGVLVRGDDLWITAAVAPRLLETGGRLAVDTPRGRRVAWISPEAAASRLVRLAGEGLPSRGRRRQGAMFLRLTPDQALADGGARTLLTRFAAAWAA